MSEQAKAGSSVGVRGRAWRLGHGAWCAAAVIALAVPAESATQPTIERRVSAGGVIEFSSRAKAVRTNRARPAQVVMPQPGSGAFASQYDAHIAEAARLYHIPEPLIRAVIQIESNFDPRAVSPANAQGLMQMIPETAERMMVTDVFDPRQNILGGTRYLRILANTFNGDLQLTIAGYNAGEGAVAKYQGIPPYRETREYVTRVLEAYRRYQDAE